MLFKNTLIKIKKSFGRYASLLAIVMVGVGFFAGIQATAPDIIAVADTYYKAHRLADFKIVSTMGLAQGDADALKALNGTLTVIPSYSLDVLDQDKAIRVHAIEPSVNMVRLIDGAMPRTGKECVADDRTYKIGDVIRIASDVSGQLKNKTFTVVGTVESVLYLADDYGNTTVGNGKLSSFIFINRDNFILDAYTEIYLMAAGTQDVVSYSEVYTDAASELNAELIKLKPEREQARYQEIYNEASGEIEKNQALLDDEKAKGTQALADANTELSNNAQKLEEAKQTLAKNEKDLQQGIEKQSAEFEEAKTQIADGRRQIGEALSGYGIEAETLDAKLAELNSAIAAMQTQLSQLPPDSEEYASLSAAIQQYSASYDGLSALKASIDTLSEQEAALNSGIETFNAETEKAKKEIEDAKSLLAENEKELSDGYAEYDENLALFNTEMTDAQAKIDEAREALATIETPQWHILDRGWAVGYDDLKASIDTVSSVAAVLPFFFILIVMLMTSNSMTRLIAEERGELGTFTSLGYQGGSIISTYLFYVLSASGLGAIAGFYIGCGVIPPLIYSMFRFILPPLAVQFNTLTFALILAVTFALMIVVTVVSCGKELGKKPAALMRPVPPGKGQTILLEKCGPVWKRLSFTWKVTVRNLFRYKKRAFMTIVGVAGCTALLLAGFGLSDSINGVAAKQYGDIFRYQDMIVLNKDVYKIDGELETLLTQEGIERPLLIRQASFQCQAAEKQPDAFLIVPQDEALFSQYYNLKSKAAGNALALNDDGVIITQKLSEILGADKGSVMTVKDADGNAYRLTVSDVAENYISNYIYMSGALYGKVFEREASYNTVVSDHNADEKTLAERLIKSDLVLNVVFTSDLMQKVLDGNESLTGIIILIVVIASLLAIIVLYNLTSINISERTREIATLKVLGFTDGETNAYIYREAFILALISVGVGLVLGIFLHRFVVDTVEGYAIFFKDIKWLSFVLAGLLTMVFSVIMQAVTYFKLRTIDMIDSLKSVE